MTPHPPTPSRRTFLGAAAAAGAALATRAGSAFAAGRADKPEVRVAVIGTGGRGSDLIRAFNTIEGVTVVGICDDYEPHLTSAAKFAGPAAQSFADYRKMLEATKPQAAAVATPLYLHHRHASDALSAGCDVFCEKTMCFTVEEARKLAEAVRQSKRIFQVGLQRRANPIYDQAAAMVRAGLIGQVTAVKSQWHRNNNWRRPVPVPKSHPDWKTLERRLNWRLYRDYSIGLMAELGSHQMDVANWLLGVPPKRCWATGGIDYWRDGREVFDNVFCTYEYELTPPTGAPHDPASGERGAWKPYTVRVTYSSLQNNAFEGASELVMGTRGTLFLSQRKGLVYREGAADEVKWADLADGKGAETNAAVVTAGKTLKLSNDPWAHRGKPVEIDTESDDTRDALVSFIDHVRRGDPKTVMDADMGLVNAATVRMAEASAREGKVVEFPADLHAGG